ncbi:retrovirus-related pol polyprotein from transposon TNT 1-94 [Tanacetum coccineum]
MFESRRMTILFPSHLNNCYYDEKKGLYGLQCLDAYSYGATRVDDSLPRKEKDPRSFTLPCYINNVCFDNALVDLGASVSVMPLSTYLNLGLGKLAHTKLTVELADRTVKYPKGIAKNVLVGIELRKDQDDDLMPTIEEGKVIDEPMIDILKTRNNESFDEEFYNSIMKDKVEYKGTNVVGAFMNVPIFVGKFSIVTHFAVVENIDGYRDQDMGDVIFGEPFCKASCVKARRIIKQDNAKQAARDEKLVPSNDRVKIGKSNLKMDPSITQREETYQVVLDIIKNTSCYNAFLISADFDIDNKTCQIDVEIFREILDISPRVPNQVFTVPLSSSNSLIEFILELGYKGQLKHISDIIGILCGLYHNANVDAAALIWKDLQYQINNHQSKIRRREIMPYPRFTRFNFPTNVVRKKTTDASKKKQSKRKLVLHDESEEYEGEPENRPTIRKKRTPRVVVIQEPLSVPVKKTQESSGKLKGIELLSNATQFEIDTQKDSNEGAGTSPEVPDESKDKSEARDDLDDWGSTYDEEYLLSYKDEKPGDISCQSIDDGESKNDDEEDDASINIEKTNDERVDTDDEDTQKGDEHAEDEQVVVPVSTTQKERPSLLQSTSIHSVSSNFGNQFINSPNASLIVSVIPETTQQPPFTPPAPPLPVTEIQSTQVPNNEAVKSVVERFTELERVVKELKQADHSTTILTSIISQVPLRDYKDIIEESVQANVINEVKNFLPKCLLKALKEALEKTSPFLGQSSSYGQSAIQAAESLFKYELKKIIYEKIHKSQSNLTHNTHQELFDALTWSMLLDEANMKKAGSNQGKKTKKRRVNESESSKKTSTTKKSSKGKSPAKTSKSGKSVTVEEPVFEIASDDVEQTVDDEVCDVGQPPHTDADKTQADADLKIPKKDWFKNDPQPKTLDPD